MPAASIGEGQSLASSTWETTIVKYSSIVRIAGLSCIIAAPLSGHAALSAYSQNFESLSAAASTIGDGWKIFGNVFNTNGSYAGGYGVFDAPNGTPGFSSIALGQGGAAQGAQQLVVYSDYNNRGAQGSGQNVEALVFQERTIAAGDVGTWTFSFDAKKGDLVSPSTAFAFIKTLNPSAGYATTNYVPLEMSAISSEWNRYSISLAVDAPLAGQLFQFGYAATATNDRASGTFYDNVSFAQALAPVPEPETYAMMLAGIALIGSLVRRSSRRRA